MYRRTARLALALSLGLLATGCGDDDEPTPSAAAPTSAEATPTASSIGGAATCTDPDGDGFAVDADGRPVPGQSAVASANVTAAGLARGNDAYALTANLTAPPSGDLRIRFEATQTDGVALSVLANYTSTAASWDVQAVTGDALEPIASKPSISQNGRITVPVPVEVLEPLGAEFTWSVAVADLGKLTGDACPDEGSVEFPG